jgi:hypothetical protein
MYKVLSLIVCSLLLVGCGIKVENSKDNGSPPPTVIDKKEETLLDFFPTQPVEKQFEGLGNEFAQYTETFFEPPGSIYPSIIDNGGTRILRLYKVTKEEISIVYEQPEFYEETPPPASSLEAEFVNNPILKLPLEVGNTFGEWTIVQVNESLTVPYGSFKEVVIIEKTDETGGIQRQYWVEKHGKIKDEYLLEDENGSVFKVTSELKTLK